ncbi:17563_t:CDS:2 [Entrophospora sp. SA101]|nr:17563_t:CDS:2 [Entrophospora sp. SA101]
MSVSEEFTIQTVKFIHSLLVSIPQYALGSLSAIAILGATPASDNSNRTGGGVTILNYRLFGWHAKQMELTSEQEECMKVCVAEASILDRLSYVVSIYYIVVGIFAGIVRAIGPCIKEEWPYIPLVLAWTLPAICRKAVGGIVVVHNPNKRIVGKITIIFMLLSLVLLSNARPLWVKVFGDYCADPTTPCFSMSDIVNK